jgi:hypothetical protein
MIAGVLIQQRQVGQRTDEALGVGAVRAFLLLDPCGDRLLSLPVCAETRLREGGRCRGDEREQDCDLSRDHWPPGNWSAVAIIRLGAKSAPDSRPGHS